MVKLGVKDSQNQFFIAVARLRHNLGSCYPEQNEGPKPLEIAKFFTSLRMKFFLKMSFAITSRYRNWIG